MVPFSSAWRMSLAGSCCVRDAELGDHRRGEAGDAHLHALEIVDGVDLLAEPTAHLRHGVAGEQTVDVVLGVERVHHRFAAALQPPGILHAAVEAERDGAGEGEGGVPVPHVVGRGVTGFHRAQHHRLGDLQRRDLRLAARDGADLELAVGALSDQLGEILRAALQRVRSDLGQLVGMRHWISGADCAMAGAARLAAAPPAPAAPAVRRKLRRFMRAMTAALLEARGEWQSRRDTGLRLGAARPVAQRLVERALALRARLVSMADRNTPGPMAHSRCTRFLPQ